VASFKAGRGKRKKGPGGRRKSLKRPDSAKEIKVNSVIFFSRALLDEARIWLNLRLGWKKLDFLHPAWRAAFLEVY
jgi:hypothetical protein